jgi:hypothetical protein
MSTTRVKAVEAWAVVDGLGRIAGARDDWGTRSEAIDGWLHGEEYPRNEWRYWRRKFHYRCIRVRISPVSTRTKKVTK